MALARSGNYTIKKLNRRNLGKSRNSIGEVPGNTSVIRASTANKSTKELTLSKQITLATFDSNLVHLTVRSTSTSLGYLSLGIILKWIHWHTVVQAHLFSTQKHSTSEQTLWFQKQTFFSRRNTKLQFFASKTNISQIKQQIENGSIRAEITTYWHRKTLKLTSCTGGTDDHRLLNF